MKKTSQVINFDKIIDPMIDEINVVETKLKEVESDELDNHVELDEIIRRIDELSPTLKNSLENEIYFNESNNLNENVDKLLSFDSTFVNEKFKKFPKLSTQDITVGILAGVLSTIIDVIFVGTPEVVKLYKGGENFDGSILTSALRKLGKNSDNELDQILKWLSDKCRVPYDISSETGVLTPNNHRLRSLAHDPFLGLMFAVADVILGTTTAIDNSGKIAVILNENKAPTPTKWLTVIYYFGHIISDVFTTRGIPIPGFFVTQFFTDEIGNSSVAKIAESMYKDGYDLRHLASMSVPVLVKDMLINLYLKLERESLPAIATIADREKDELDFKLKTLKMMFVSNLIATTGNAVKFLAPPVCGNPCALNMVQWMALLNNSVTLFLAQTRDISTEKAIMNRKSIDEMWRSLLIDLE
jgi:hypothetical protein